MDGRSSWYVVARFVSIQNVGEEQQRFKMLPMEPVYSAANGDEEVGIGKIPEMVFNDDRRGVWIDRGDSSIEDGFKIGRHKVMVQFRET